MRAHSLGPCNKPKVKVIAIILCEATVSKLSKQEGEVKEVNHKVCERRTESIKARKIGHIRQTCVKESEIEPGGREEGEHRG